MNKTKVDDMLIEMISPKVKEIEEKFARGEGLSQDDINTLLLKSQYNHINHLDIKLDETVESVKELEKKFDLLEQRVDAKIQGLDSKINGLKKDFDSLEQRVDAKINALQKDFKALEQKVSSDIKSLEEKIETTIQKALNKNIMLLIVIIGFFITLSKLIDKF